MAQDIKYQAGETYADPKAQTTGFIDDLKAIGFKHSRADLETILEVVHGLGKPLDDKKFTVRPP